METEIEIKFLFNSQFESELYQQINAQGFISNKTQMLQNVYFDTDNRLLREMDMGLRVRSCDGRSVQTIKTAGRVIGGLHQRPEYNEPIEGVKPELARFNEKIWPTNCDIKKLEETLLPIFSTDFIRQTWLVEMDDDTLIEVAYDRGFIETAQGKIDISEVELELIKGDETKLFIFGNKIAELPEVRLGNVSKAQRGYMLMNNTSFAVKPLEPSPITATMSIQQALLTNIQHGLKHIQYHENCYVESCQHSALRELFVGIKFIHQNLTLFKEQFPDLHDQEWVDDLHWLARSFSWVDTRQVYHRLLKDKGYYLRKLPKLKGLLDNIKALDNALPDKEKVLELLNSTRYCQFVLTLTKWLIFFEKSTFSSEKKYAIESFSEQCLSQSWDELIAILSPKSVDHLLAYQGGLESNLLMGSSLGNLFSQQRREIFHSPWLDIKNGLKKLAMLDAVFDIVDSEEDPALKKEYCKWLTRKKESLLDALALSKEQALLKNPYWEKQID
jgi:triphosphatase